jgi:thymidylate synthase ThyX
MYKSEVLGKGGIEARVVADSISRDYKRITTFELRYHRFIHGEFMTHRLFSRNASSSRAIPVKTMLEQVAKEPATPIHWGKNKSGMQAEEELADGSSFWNDAASDASNVASIMAKELYHKQITNRLLEPFQFIKVVVTATEWDNFFHLRVHPDAQPEIQELAKTMKRAQDESTPDSLSALQWHLPYVSKDEINTAKTTEELIRASVSRCARVSYMKHDNTNPTLEEDSALYNMLAVRPFTDKNGNTFDESDPLHLSPLEHQAQPMVASTEWSGMKMGWWRTEKNNGITHSDRQCDLWSANFKGWVQFRQLI